MNRLASLLQRIGGPRAVSPLAWLILSPVAILGVPLSFGPELLARHTAELFGISLASYLVTGPIFLLAWLTYLRPSPDRKSRPGAALLTFVAASAVAGLVIGFLISWSNLDADPDILGRTAARTWLGLYWSVVVTLLLDSSDSYRDASQKLKQEARRLNQMVLARTDHVLEVRRRMVDTVTKTISEALKKGDPASLNAVADQVITPLTRFIEETASKPYLIPEKSLEKVKIGPVIATALKSPRNILLTATIGATYPIAASIWRFGLLGILNVFGIWLAIASTLFIVRTFARNRAWLGLLLISTGAVLDAFFAFTLEQLATGSITSLSNLTLGSWLITPFFLVTFELGHARKITLEQMEQKISEGQWAERRLHQEIWVESRKLAKVVHGTVQGRIRSAAVSQTYLNQNDLEALSQECIRLVELGPESQSVDEFLEQSRRLWAGILEIDISADPEALQKVDSDPIARTSLLEVMREAFTNAVRHGSASNAWIELAVLVEGPRQLLKIKISNNGKPLAVDQISGFGSSVFDEVTSKWDLKQLKNRVVLTAELALDPSLG